MTCNRCGKSEPEVKFYKRENGKDGKRGECSGCRVDINRRYRQRQKFSYEIEPVVPDVDTLELASCKNTPWGTMFEPKFSLVEQYCATCPIQKECVALVVPTESWFTGIAGGQVFENGRHIKQPKCRKCKDSIEFVAGPGRVSLCDNCKSPSAKRDAITAKQRYEKRKAYIEANEDSFPKFKKCATCKEMCLREDFGVQYNFADGRNGSCKACEAKKARIRRERKLA